MKSSLIKYIVIVLTVVFSSCEKVIDFDGKIPDPMLVVNCVIVPDSVITVHLTRSKFFLSKSYEFTNVENATVNMYINNSELEELKYIGDGVYQSAKTAKANDIVKITAEKAGLNSVESEVVVQPMITILSVDTTWVSTEYTGPIYDSLYNEIGKSTYAKVNVRVRFKDDGNEQNYYQLFVQKRTTDYYKVKTGEIYEQVLYNSWDIEYDDVVFGNTQSETDILGLSGNALNRSFSDELFNGKEYSLSFSTMGSKTEYFDGKTPTDKPAGKEDIEISLNRLSKSYYLYLRSANASMNVDFFSEPVQVYSNVKDGLGILGSYTTTFNQFYLGEFLGYSGGYYGNY